MAIFKFGTFQVSLLPGADGAVEKEREERESNKREAQGEDDVIAEYEFRFVFHVETRVRMPMDEYLKIDASGNPFYTIAQHHAKQQLVMEIRNLVYNDKIYDNIKIVERLIK